MQLRLTHALLAPVLLTAALLGAQTAPPAAPAIDGIPGPLNWINQPASFQIENRSRLTIASGPGQDWYIDAFDAGVTKSAPILAFDPGPNFTLSAKVKVDFRSAFDAGSLMLYADDHHWAKFAFEYSVVKQPTQPTLVSVVTRGTSDDTVSQPIPGDTVYLRISRRDEAFIFYVSSDGVNWQILRVFRLDAPGKVLVGFESQSPSGQGSKATFSEIHFSPKRIPNPYTGK